MDVDHEHFRKQLLPILRNIANADFVTFDLEMSGISTRPKYSSGDRSRDVSKPTLEQQYQELKSAAEAFQVLQMGITCVGEDRDKGERSFFLLHCLWCPALCIWTKAMRVHSESHPRRLGNLHGRSQRCLL